MSEQAFFRSMRLHYLSLFVNKKISKQALCSGTLSVFGLEGKRKKEEMKHCDCWWRKAPAPPRLGAVHGRRRSLSEGVGSTSWMVFVSRWVSTAMRKKGADEEQLRTVELVAAAEKSPQRGLWGVRCVQVGGEGRPGSLVQVRRRVDSWPLWWWRAVVFTLNYWISSKKNLENSCFLSLKVFSKWNCHITVKNGI